MAGYRSLRAWQISHQLALAVREVSRRFPKHERFELAAQLRRAALSAPTNLVEGRAQFGAAQYLRYVRIAIASLAEVDYLLFVASECGYISRAEYRKLERLRLYATRLVYRLARSLDTARR